MWRSKSEANRITAGARVLFSFAFCCRLRVLKQMQCLLSAESELLLRRFACLISASYNAGLKSFQLETCVRWNRFFFVETPMPKFFMGRDCLQICLLVLWKPRRLSKQSFKGGPHQPLINLLILILLTKSLIKRLFRIHLYDKTMLIKACKTIFHRHIVCMQII